MQEIKVWSVDQEDPWRTGWLPTPVSLPGESHGQSSLLLGCPGGATGKELACQSKSHERRWSDPYKDPLEAGTATHSSILAWKIPWTEEPGGLHSIGSQRGRRDWSNLACNVSPELLNATTGNIWWEYLWKVSFPVPLPGVSFTCFPRNVIRDFSCGDTHALPNTHGVPDVEYRHNIFLLDPDALLPVTYSIHFLNIHPSQFPHLILLCATSSTLCSCHFICSIVTLCVSSITVLICSAHG